jgi:predicted nicotinamide N-methyase
MSANPPVALQARLNRLLPDITLRPTPLPGTPGIRLWLLDKLVDRRLEQQVATALMAAPPYWALCWASGQVLAALLLAEPERVRGRRVVDVGCGSGVVAIAAALAGAASVSACDLDPDALAATAANAALNGVTVTLTDDLSSALAAADLVAAADILYDRDNLPLLALLPAPGRRVLLADSRIADLDPPGYRRLGEWPASTWPDLGESSEYNRVRIFQAG